MYRKIKRKINLYRRFPYFKETGAIFVHVPKAAGTSIAHALYGRTLGHYTAEEYRHCFPSLYNSAFVFSFVRNPWSRALSAYRFAKQGKTESMAIDKPFQYEIPEFESFRDFVLGWLPNQDLKNSDFVFRRQSDFLIDNDNNLIVDFVGKVENIYEDLKIVQDELGSSLSLPRLNTTGGQDYSKHYLDQKMINVVGDIYAEDVKRFQYSF